MCSCVRTHTRAHHTQKTMVKEQEVMSLRNVSDMGGAGERVYGNNVTMGLMKEILKKKLKSYIFLKAYS